MPPIPLLDQILGRGYAQKRLTPAATSYLMDLCFVAREFFSRGPEEKGRHNGPDATGYDASRVRGPGVESFGYRRYQAALVPDEGPLRPFLGLLENCRQVMLGVVDELVQEMTAYYACRHQLVVDGDSLLLVESYVGEREGQLRQPRRVDDGLVTVLWATGDGLEGKSDLGLWGFPSLPDAVWLFPGKSLTALTDEAVQPLAYQVRNLNVGRQGVTFFAGVDTSGPVLPFVVNRLTGSGDVRPLLPGGGNTHTLDATRRPR